MTYKEVLEALKCGMLDLSDIEPYLDLIKQAIEKQIPIQTNIHGYRTGREVNTISYTCPACNKHISNEDKYCKHCGQALDWSE